jgi:hypothetical protein
MAKHVRIHAQSDADRVYLSMECFDATGARCDSADLTAVPLAHYDDRWISPVGDPAASNPNARVIQLTPEEVEVSRRIKFDIKALPAWFQNPQNHEPLDLATPPVLSALAEEDGSNPVVIDASDLFWTLTYVSQKDGRVNLEAFKSLMARWDHYERVSADGATVWRPRYFDYSEARVADRKALSRYAKAFATTGSRDWLAQSRLYRAGGASISPLSRFFVLVSTGKWQGQMTPETDCLYRLIGAISSADWERLLAGRRVTVAELGVTSELQALLREDQAKSQSDGKIPDLLSHPAELFRGFELGEAAVEVHGATDYLLRDIRAGSPEIEELWGTPAMLYSRGFARYGGRPTPHMLTTREEFESRLGSSTYRTASAERITFVLRLPSRCSITCSWAQGAKDISGVVTYADLPKPVRDEVWRLACEQAKARYDQRIAAGLRSN